jgi:hypothetical protein
MLLGRDAYEQRPDGSSVHEVIADARGDGDARNSEPADRAPRHTEPDQRGVMTQAAVPLTAVAAKGDRARHPGWWPPARTASGDAQSA